MKYLPLIILALCTLAGKSQTILARQQVITLNTGGSPSTSKALLWLPDTYNTELKTYPLIISMVGRGEMGDDLDSLVKHDGQLATRIAKGWNPVSSSGDKFIVCTPQGPAKSWGWNLPHISNFIDQLKAKYRVDPNRIYLTGLSAGSWGIQQAFTDANLANKVAGIVLMVCASTVNQGCINIAQKKIPTWIIGGTADPHFINDVAVRKVMNANGFQPLFTGIPGGDHDSWKQGYDPFWSDTASKGKNIYDWLVTNVKNTSTSKSNTYNVPPGATNYPMNPGDTLVFNGTYSYLNNTGSGTKDKPVYLYMKNATFTQGLDFHDANYFKIFGDGTDSSNYTFKILCKGSGTALSFQGNSNHVEVSNVTIKNPSYFVWWKEEPNCIDTLIPKTLDDFYLHDFYFDTAHQDGLYLLSTDENANRAVNCNGKIYYPRPGNGSNIHIKNGIIKNSQRNAINYSNVIGGDSNIIENVRIENAGYEYKLTKDPNALFQGAGIATGRYVNGLTIKNCIIKNTFLPNIVSRAGGKVKIINNTLDSATYVWGTTNIQLQANLQVTASDIYPTTLEIHNNTIGWSNNGVKMVIYGSPILDTALSCVTLPAGSQNKTGSNLKSCDTAVVIPPVDSTGEDSTTIDSSAVDTSITGVDVIFHRADGSSFSPIDWKRIVINKKGNYVIYYTDSTKEVLKDSSNAIDTSMQNNAPTFAPGDIHLNNLIINPAITLTPYTLKEAILNYTKQQSTP